jgi:anti-sigma factor RsiW
MNHHEIRQLLPAYVDDELSIAEALAIERHLPGCPDCQRACMEQRSVKTLVSQHAGYAAAPAHLAQQLAAALPMEKPRPAPAGRRPATWLSRTLAIAGLSAAVLGGAYYLNLSSMGRQAAQEVAFSHIRSLQADHLFDIASSDEHTVKPWFNGKLAFSPPVVDLASQGFPLTGGRLDFLDGHPAAVLVYRHNRHPINLYVWPGEDHDAPLQAQEYHGYHLMRWTADKMHYWAISDLAADELAVFAASLRAAIGKTSRTPDSGATASGATARTKPP